VSTGAIIAIVVIALIVLGVVLVALPRMKQAQEERGVQRERSEVADHHRTEAQQREARAEMAEKAAQRERAEAEMQQAKARLHDEGLADDQLPRNREAEPGARGR
jgi:hypothetical protein